MTRREKFSVALYLVSIVAALLFAVLTLTRCSGNKYEPAPSAPQAAACLERGVGEMLTSRSCREALEALRGVVRSYPECAEVLTPKGAEATSLTLGAVTLLCDEWEPDGGGHE